jgi:hypothetical protein
LVMVNQISAITKKRAHRAILAVALGGVFGLGLGTAIPQFAYAANEPAGASLSSDTAANIQAQIKAAVGNVSSMGLTGPALDDALAAAISNVVVSDVATYGHAGEIASIVIASNAAPAADIGAGLGRAAVQLAKSDFRAGAAIARAVANEGAPGEPAAFASVVNLAGDPLLAGIAQGAPVVTGSTGVGVTVGGSTPPPPPAPPPPCSNPSCS